MHGAKMLSDVAGGRRFSSAVDPRGRCMRFYNLVYMQYLLFIRDAPVNHISFCAIASFSTHFTIK